MAKPNYSFAKRQRLGQGTEEEEKLQRKKPLQTKKPAR